MNNAQIAAITAAVIAALGSQKSRAKRKNYGVVAKKSGYSPKLSAVPEDKRQDKQMKRLAAIGRGFAAKGIKVTFDKATGRFDNVKPYKVWLSEGLIVRRGQHGVQGLFHSSQCEKYVPPVVNTDSPVAITVLPPESREHFERKMELGM